MNLTNKRAPQIGEEIVHDNGINSVIKPGIREKKIVLIDADSLVYWSLISPKDEFGNKIEYTIDDIEELESKLRESVFKIFNAVEQYFDMSLYMLFIRGKNNFRKKLYKPYKVNRPEPNPLTIPLYQFLIDEFGAIESHNFEAEDYLYTAYLTIGKENCIICYIDHDLLEINGILYNYQKDKWTYNSEENAKYELAKKLIVSESGDNVNLCPKVGEVWFKKNVTIGMSDYSYLRAIYRGYLKATKGNHPEAKNNLRLAWKLLKLHNINQK